MKPFNANRQVSLESISLETILNPSKRCQSPREPRAEVVDYLFESPQDPRHKVDKVHIVSSCDSTVNLPCFLV